MITILNQISSHSYMVEKRHVFDSPSVEKYDLVKWSRAAENMSALSQALKPEVNGRHFKEDIQNTFSFQIKFH